MNVPLSLYIHFPWCVKKCPYCDFNSHETSGAVPEAAYLDALETDLIDDIKRLSALNKQSTKIEKPEIQTIFMGGGTPSLFSANAIQDLLNRLKQHLTFAINIEITIEANPGTLSFEKLAGYYQAGINRLSLGGQSFNNQHLNLLGRIHSSSDITTAFENASRAGFKNINLDLMHGLSQQTISNAINDLQQAIELQPTHISWYQLTIEPNTRFYNEPPRLPTDDTLWEIYQTGLNLLAQHGFHRYEVSAFSQSGQQAKHNVNYWLFGDYIGIGAGAHGKLSSAEAIIRTAKTRSPKDYLKQQKCKSSIIDEKSLSLEFLMNALRLNEGFTKRIYEQRTGLNASRLENFLTAGMTKGLLQQKHDKIIPTALGIQYLNDLLMLFD
ncbi:MAG: radical SAM family heme chaperone HemW [Pseudomonadales bacterium]|nr:radical SAM family heme chaperone HemW [Pseudomonadales bacterium]